MSNSEEPASAQDPLDLTRFIRNAYVLTLLFLGLGITTTYPYLQRELARIEPAERLLIGASELPALLWFTWYFVKHCLLIRPVDSTPATASFASRQWWLALVTLVVGQGLGLWTCIGLWRDDIAGRDRAIATEGQMVAISKWTTVMAYGYFIDVDFTDQRGDRHQGVYHVVENKKKGFLLRLPNDMKKALKDRTLPSPVQLYYDPEWPARNWLAEAGGDLVDDYKDRLYYFGICLLVVQLVAVFNFAVALAYQLKRGRQVPWWYDLHLALPLMILAVFSGFLGGFLVGLSALFDLLLREN
jgi:hypothetical protein